MQLIIADNNSTDDSISYLHSIGFEPFCADSDWVPQKKLILELPENFGFAKGYNIALQKIRYADYFVLLNSDVEVSPNWIEPIIEIMDSDIQVAAAMPKVLMHGNKTLFEHAGAAGGWMDSYGYPFCRGRIFGALEEDLGQYNTNAEIFWASGAAMFIRSDLFIKLGGFDGDYFAHMEEIDLCWRLKKANYKIIVCPESVVMHVGGGTLPAENPKKDYLNFRNSLSTLLKNKETVFGAIATVFVRLLLDGVAALMFLSKGKFIHIGAIIKAHWNFFYNFRKHWKKRKLNQNLIAAAAFEGKPIFNNKGLYDKSIVFQHFVKKIKKFSDLKS
jgi:GT2 family glycosyltransferase